MTEVDRLSRAYFNRLAPDWDMEKFSKNDRLLSMLRRIRFHWAGDLLDIGCGTGILFPILKKLTGPETRIYAIDYASCMTEYAAKKKGNSVHIACGDIQALPFRSERFDCIIAFQVIPHIHRLFDALRECHRILKSGGELMIIHLDSSRDVNAFHAEMDAPVKTHILLPPDHMSRMLREANFAIDIAIDRRGKYFVGARKK